MSADARTIEVGKMEPPLGEIRFLFLPRRDLFARRADRLRFLSRGHPAGDYFRFLATLADGQQEALGRLPPFPLPDAVEQARCRTQGVPLLDARSHRRDPAWRTGLKMILEHMGKAALPAAAVETIEALTQAGDARLEETADRIVSEELAAVAPRELPFVAAALQAYWARMAASLKKDVVGRLEQGGVCPVCGSHPTGGIVRSSGAEHGLRYLCCSLCSSEWHMVRIKCSSCESTRAIDYHILEGSNGAVKVESCGDCNVYLKLLYLEKDPQMEMAADDLATLGLDILMEKEGKRREGPNLYFHPGTRTDSPVISGQRKIP